MIKYYTTVFEICVLLKHCINILITASKKSGGSEDEQVDSDQGTKKNLRPRVATKAK